MSLIDFFDQYSVADALVAEHVAECGPPGIKDGFRHPGLRQALRIHIADCDITEGAHELSGLLVQEMLSGVGDLGVDRLGAALVPGALSAAEGRFIGAKDARCSNRPAVAEHRKGFQTEVDADMRPVAALAVQDFALEIDIPSAARVNAEAASLDLPVDLARFPEPELALKVGHLRPVHTDGTRNKRYPAERFFGGAPAGTATNGVTPRGKLAAHGLDRIGVQAEVGSRASAELDQIESAGPLPVPLHGVPLRAATIIPNEGHGASMASEVLACRRVLDPELECDKHAQTNNQSEAEMQDYRTGRHCVFALHVHLVFVTKFRRDVLSEPAIRDLAAIFASICKDFEAALVECSGEDDHVHLLVEYPPKVTLSKLVNSLKGVSSRLLREDRPEIAGRYFKGVLWSPSYFAASCGGAPISIIRQYIEQQRSAPPPRPERRGFRALRG